MPKSLLKPCCVAVLAVLILPCAGLAQIRPAPATAGEFLEAPQLALPSLPVSIATGDFNGDGRSDFAVVVGGAVAVFLGRANGTFQTGAQYTCGTGPVAVAVGDFNGDHKVDLVVANSGGTVSVLLGNGDGTFQGGNQFQRGRWSELGGRRRF